MSIFDKPTTRYVDEDGQPITTGAPAQTGVLEWVLGGFIETLFGTSQPTYVTPTARPEEPRRPRN